MTGYLSKRAMKMVQDWLDKHRDEIQQDWDLAVSSQPLIPVPPLD